MLSNLCAKPIEAYKPLGSGPSWLPHTVSAARTIMDKNHQLDPMLGGHRLHEQQYQQTQDGAPAPKRPRPSSENLSHLESPSQGSQRLISEPLDYPRRRATIACEICRSRKSKCDGARPKCKLCTDLGADCVYREPGVKLDAGDKLILERLAHIEGLLHSNILRSVGTPSVTTGPISPAPSNTVSEDMQSKRMSATIAGNGTGVVNTSGHATNISTMPKAHTTPALHLLQWPVIRDLVSRQCDQQTLMQLELVRPDLDLQPPTSLDLNLEPKDGNPALYIRSFFDKVNVWYAVVNPYTFATVCRQAATVHFRYGVETCIVLLVLALGQASQSGHSISHIPHGQPVPGRDYFNAAWLLMPMLMLRNDVQSAQCHVLAAAYLM